MFECCSWSDFQNLLLFNFITIKIDKKKNKILKKKCNF
jgi:hypothetical protein